MSNSATISSTEVLWSSLEIRTDPRNPGSVILTFGRYFWLIRFSRTSMFLGGQPPSPRHLPLWASSIVEAFGLPLADARCCWYPESRRAGTVEDRALLASTPPLGTSPPCGRAAVQWHRSAATDCRHGGIALLLHSAAADWPKTENAKGPGTESPIFWVRRHQSTRKPDEPF